MARPPRHCDPDKYYLLTNRTLRAKYFMRPDKAVREIILGCLAKWAARYDVEIVCFTFLSNHFHIIARFPNRNMSKFMEQFQGQIAERINGFRGRDGTFWHDRYDDTVILDGQMLKEKIAYVVNNAVGHRLVTHAENWPGICSFDWHKSGEPVEGKWLNKTEQSRLERKGKSNARERAKELYTFDLHLPEELGGADKADRRHSLLELVEQDRKRLEKERKTDREGVAGARAITHLDWQSRPEEPEEAPSVLCVTADPDKRKRYRDKRRRITDDYRAAVRKWRKKEVAEFPVGTIPPGWRRCVSSSTDLEPPEPTANEDSDPEEVDDASDTQPSSTGASVGKDEDAQDPNDWIADEYSSEKVEEFSEEDYIF